MYNFIFIKLFRYNDEEDSGLWKSRSTGFWDYKKCWCNERCDWLMRTNKQRINSPALNFTLDLYVDYLSENNYTIMSTIHRVIQTVWLKYFLWFYLVRLQNHYKKLGNCVIGYYYHFAGPSSKRIIWRQRA